MFHNQVFKKPSISVFLNFFLVFHYNKSRRTRSKELSDLSSRIVDWFKKENVVRWTSFIFQVSLISCRLPLEGISIFERLEVAANRFGVPQDREVSGSSELIFLPAFFNHQLGPTTRSVIRRRIQHQLETARRLWVFPILPHTKSTEEDYERRGGSHVSDYFVARSALVFNSSEQVLPRANVLCQDIWAKPIHSGNYSTLSHGDYYQAKLHGRRNLGRGSWTSPWGSLQGRRTLYKEEVLSAALAILLIPLGPNGGISLAICQNGEKRPNNSRFLLEKLINHLQEWDRL